MAKCSINDCLNRSRKRGWCEKHYIRWSKYGDPTITLKRHTKTVEPNRTGRCTLDECDSPSRNGTSHYCEKHYTRVKRHGDPNVALKDHTPAIERWKTSYEVDSVSGCWNWRGPILPQGHGFIQDGAQKRYMAHRFVWEQVIGPIPKGFVVDHNNPEFGCHNKRCVNPEHLELVTQAINCLRGGRDGGNAAKTKCPAGHEYTPENTYRNPTTGWRGCITCRNSLMRQKKYRYAYIYLYRPNHPIANKSGSIQEHRMVLYDAIGVGPHPCRWCAVMLEWDGIRGLHVDHLDGDPSNNWRDNLVPSCQRCNKSRAASGNLADWKPPPKIGR